MQTSRTNGASSIPISTPPSPPPNLPRSLLTLVSAAFPSICFWLLRKVLLGAALDTSDGSTRPWPRLLDNDKPLRRIVHVSLSRFKYASSRQKIAPCCLALLSVTQRGQHDNISAVVEIWVFMVWIGVITALCFSLLPPRMEGKWLREQLAAQLTLKAIASRTLLSAGSIEGRTWWTY